MNPPVAIECVWMGWERDVENTTPQPGWMFFGGDFRLSNKYMREVRYIRPPISIVLPDRKYDGSISAVFCIDSAPGKNENDHWDVKVDYTTLVVGQKPDISVSPSIDIDDAYHGYLTKGVLTPDMDVNYLWSRHRFVDLGEFGKVCERCDHSYSEGFTTCLPYVYTPTLVKTGSIAVTPTSEVTKSWRSPWYML